MPSYARLVLSQLRVGMFVHWGIGGAVAGRPCSAPVRPVGVHLGQVSDTAPMEPAVSWSVSVGGAGAGRPDGLEGLEIGLHRW